MVQGVSKVPGSAGKKRSAEAWTLSQSSKSPAKVAAARKGLEGKLSKPRKSSQVRTWLSHNSSISVTTYLSYQVYVATLVWGL